MLRAGLFWKLLIASGALSVLTIVAFSLTLLRAHRTQLNKELDQRLRSAAAAIRELVEIDWQQGPTAELQLRAAQFGKETNTRLTIIRDDGVVLADSDQDDLEAVLAMEPHDTRPEVIEAGRSGSAVVTRRSPTIGQFFRYYASPVDVDGQRVGFVRMAYPVDEIARKISGVRRYVWAAGACVAAIAVAATYWLASRLSAPLRTLTSEAEALAAGEYQRRVSVSPSASDDMSVLGRTLNDMAQKIAQRERQLIETNQTQATVLEGMTESVIAVDAAQRILFANAAAERLFAFDAEEAAGRQLMEVVRSHELLDLVRAALAQGKLAESELAWHGSRPTQLEVHANPLPGNPCPGAIIVLHDVSEIKRLEALRQQFVANVSHELKTPLSSIKAYTETLLSGASNDPQHCELFLKRIDEQSDRLHELIRDILHLGSIESGQAALDIVDVPLSRVLDRCVADYEQRAQAAHIQLRCEIDPLTPHVRADEEGLQLILSNLIDNAIKYTPEGGSVSIRGRFEDRHATIDVVDTGIGVSAEHHARLFERFFRVDRARSRELGGTGLGLSIVKHLAQAMGGRVAVQSQPGQGSTFSVTFRTVGASRPR